MFHGPANVSCPRQRRGHQIVRVFAVVVPQQMTDFMRHDGQQIDVLARGGRNAYQIRMFPRRGVQEPAAPLAFTSSVRLWPHARPK